MDSLSLLFVFNLAAILGESKKGIFLKVIYICCFNILEDVVSWLFVIQGVLRDSEDFIIFFSLGVVVW